MESAVTLHDEPAHREKEPLYVAAKVDREIIRSSVELRAVDFEEHVGFVIGALKPHADELGIAGRI